MCITPAVSCLQKCFRNRVSNLFPAYSSLWAKLNDLLQAFYQKTHAETLHQQYLMVSKSAHYQVKSLKTCHCLWKPSYRSSFLNQIFQSIHQIWVKYLNIKVWKEFYKCLRSAKKTKQLRQVFLRWVNAQLCYTWPQLPRAKWEKPAALPVVWRKNYTSFKSSVSLALGLTFQSVYKKIFTCSLMFSLNAHVREDALFFFQTVYVQCPDGSCTAWTLL